LKKQARIVSSQYRNAQPISAQKPFSTQNKPNRALTPLSSDQSCNELSSTRNSEDHSKNIEASNRSPTQRTREHDKDNEESFNSSGSRFNDDILVDDEIDQNTTATTDPDPDADADADTDTDTDTKQIDDKQNNDPLVIKYNRLVEKCNRLKNRINKLENENEILKKKTMPLPPPEVQQWFKYTAQRFENKLLSGSVLKDFSGALGMPSNVLISLTQDTGSLTARAIVRYLYPSKTRVLSDIENKTREAILNYVKFCHPNEVFVRGKINEAISGPFRTATFKTRPEDENRSVTNIYDDVKTSSDLEINSQEDTEDDSEWIDEKKSETQYDERIAYEQMSSLKRNLTKKEIATALIILKVRHRLTTMAISDICRLLRLLDVPNAPKSFSAVKRLIEQEATDKIKPDVLNICHSCNSVFKRTCDNQKCQSNSQQIRSPNFLKFLLKDQIQLILESENNFTLYSQLPSLSNDHIAEIQHADWYRSVAENEDGSNFITLLLNVDGIAMSGSSDNSLWIFTFIINEIKRSDRYKLQNCILGGVWPGPKKPSREQIYAMLKSMTDELQLLENENVYIVRALGNQMIKLKVFLIGSTCDKPAQAIVQNIAEPIGKYGCGRCEIPGITVPSRDGVNHYIRVFPLSSESSDKPQCRSNRNYDTIMALKNPTEDERKGYLGQCALRLLKHFDV
ncbi:unnamed protein product, partial [Rotaria magnacalcarata]